MRFKLRVRRGDALNFRRLMTGGIDPSDLSDGERLGSYLSRVARSGPLTGVISLAIIGSLIACDDQGGPARPDEPSAMSGVMMTEADLGEDTGGGAGELAGERAGDVAGDVINVRDPLTARCQLEERVTLSSSADVKRVTLMSEGASIELSFAWGDDPLKRLLWDGVSANPLETLDEALPQVGLGCVDSSALELGDLSVGDEARLLVSPPLLVTPRVESRRADHKWVWRRPARLRLGALLPRTRPDGSPRDAVKLNDLELWWWPLLSEPTLDEDADTLLANLGAPKRIMLRDPTGEIAKRADATRAGTEGAIELSVDEWGVYALIERLDPPTERALTYRAVVGISMGGGGAAHLGSRHPERFDFIGAMGGPTDWLYMMHYVTDRLLSGFCTGDALGEFCGTGPVRQPIEQYADFQNFIYANNGVDFTRDQYLKIFQDVVFALGNPTQYNPQSPYLPIGIPSDELLRSSRDRCAADCGEEECDVEEWIKLPMFYDRDFNPSGEAPVIPFCDGESDEGSFGVWEPVAHDRPTDLFLAVDLNDNGRRDEGEPVIRQLSERFRDVGCDGVASVDEAGYDPLFNPDPAGDDFHWLYNPFGAEGDNLFEGAGGDVGLEAIELLPETVRESDRADLETLRASLARLACAEGEPGEPFDDDGLDGVPLTLQVEDGGFDWGEGNGHFDYNPNKISYIANTPSLWLDRARVAEGLGPRFWIDGGIRDTVNFAVAGMYLAGRLNDLSARSVVLYESFKRLLGRDVFIPDASDAERFLNSGEHVMLRYGDPDATPEQIANGDGAHVGSDADAVSRLNGALHWLVTQWFDALGEDAPGGGDSAARTVSDSVESERFGGRYHFEIVLPPGYDDPENAEQRYPVVYIFHGYGQTARALTPASLLLGSLMQRGVWPGVIFVYADGACSDMTVFACSDGVDNDGDGLVDLDDPGCEGYSRRGSEVDDGDDVRRCADGVDNDRDGLVDLDDPGCLNERHNDEGECRTGTFYMNHVAAKDGVRRGRDYEGALLDMMDYIDANYRVR